MTYKSIVCLLVFLVVGLISVVSSPEVLAGTPQTVTVDGSNDFLAANLIEVDGGDTEHVPLDLDSLFITNDANKLFIGFGYDKDGWTGNQLGICIAVNSMVGGTTDAWGHAVAWNTAPRKPWFQAWCDMDGSWQELRVWNPGTTSWDVSYSGTSSLGWVNNTGFEEIGLNLTDLGVSAGDTVFIEVVSTQSGGTKGPFDVFFNDDLQLSTPGGTTWDVGTPVELDSMYMYIIEASGDSDPPTVLGIEDNGSLAEAGVVDLDLTFSEPVDETTAETVSNYVLYNIVASLDSVVRRPDLYSVRLYFDASISPGADIRSVRVINVEDMASNVIVDNDTTNVGNFFLKGVLFRGRMSKHLETTSFPVDTFTVEGDLSPLSWGLCDNAFMSDTGGGVYEQPVVFTLYQAGARGGDCPTLVDYLEWKFVHQCSEYESISNRQAELRCSTGAWDTIDVWWNDVDPGQYTTNPVDVVFLVNANSMSPTIDSIVTINGSVLPLTFDVPSLNQMSDDGTGQDAVAADGIYTVVIRFPANSFKNAGFKYLYNDVYECQLEGNRDLWLNDAEFDTIGGTLGPIYMPLQYFDRCSTIGRDVEVVFTVLTKGFGGSSDTVAVNGTPNNQLPEVINWNVPSINELAWINGYGDHTGLGEYTVSIVFPDSSNRYQEYKYLHNSLYECDIPENRVFYVDDSFDASGNPQILPVDYFGSCVTVDVPDGSVPIPIVLKQNYPNPFNPATTIKFSVAEKGHASLRIFDVRGALIRTLVDRIVEAGEVSVLWDGTDNNGRSLASGVYFLNLRKGDETMTRKMIMLR